MIRVQIYLTEHERKQLHTLARQTSRSQSDLIREAIDQFIEGKTKQKEHKLAGLKAARGMWADRADLPDFSKLRKEFDRKNSENEDE